MSEKFNLTWHTFSSHGRELFKNLLEAQEFTDVTLISDDHHQYRVHKFILSACSTTFRKILTSSPLNSSIYLRGIHHEEVESILQFFYLGEATFYHERMNEFLNVAKNLDIKEIEEIAKNFVDEDEETEGVDEHQGFDEEYPGESDNLQNNGEANSSRQYIDVESSHSLIPDDKKSYDCQQCDYKATLKNTLTKHVQSKHEGVKYTCKQCDYQFTHSSSLKEHMMSKHEGVKYTCKQCDYQFTRSSSLREHIKSKHEGIKYPCQQCDYQAKHTFHLQSHIKFKHEGIKYPCHQCVYQATTMSNLKQHIKSKHEGIKYPCQQCDYQATQRVLLQSHIKSKHAGI